jgi:uncharacterized iron-regulated protein
VHSLKKYRITGRAFVAFCWPVIALLLLPATAGAQAPWHAQLQTLPGAAVVLLGEQHDAPEHQELARLSVQALAGAQRLSALVLEMADEGLSTEGMSAQSSEALVRERLQWNHSGWPWRRYGPVVMQAVRAGAPVVGGNLPRAAMGAVMRDVQYDDKVTAAILAGHRQRMRDGHCGLLPESQVPAMARIQIARDALMAQTVSKWVRDGQTVLLLAGAEHVKKDRGIPLFMPANSASALSVVWMQAATRTRLEPELADVVWQTPPVPFKDHCAELATSIDPAL